MRRFCWLVAVLVALRIAAAEQPYFTVNVDGQYPRKAFRIEAHRGASPIIEVRLLTNGTAYTSLSSGYTSELVYAKTDKDTIAGSVTGTLTVGTGVILFNCTTSDFSQAGDYYAQILLRKAEKRLVWGQGLLRINE